MPQGNLVEVLRREVRQGSPGELMVESSPSRPRWPSCKTNKEMSDEAAALTYLLTYCESEKAYQASIACARANQATRNCKLIGNTL